MAEIRSTCSECNADVIGYPRDYVVIRMPHTQAYTNVCPKCGKHSHKPCNERTAELLAAAGVRVRHVETPAEVFERPLDAPPLTHDELLDFHDLIADDARLEALVAALIEPRPTSPTCEEES